MILKKLLDKLGIELVKSDRSFRGMITWAGILNTQKI